MKVRIGYGPAPSSATDTEAFASLVDGLETHGFDSLWLADRVGRDGPAPLPALAVAAGRTTRLKLGTSVLVVPGRNPALLAEELATIDRLSGGRLLPAVGLGAVDPGEQQAFGVARPERGPLLDEVLPLLRRFWTGEPVTHHGERYRYDDVRVLPTPSQDPLEVWLGGRAPSELRRAGRLGDGWLPSFSTPDEAAAGRAVVEEAAARAGRAIDPEHWGALVVYSRGAVPDRLAALVRARRPDVDVADVVPDGPGALRTLLERFCDRGFSKFVVLPAAPPPSWDDELADIAAEVLPLQG